MFPSFFISLTAFSALVPCVSLPAAQSPCATLVCSFFSLCFTPFFYLLIFLLPASFVWFKLPFCFFSTCLLVGVFFFLWVLLNWWNLTISSLLVFIIIKYIWNIASHPLSDVHRNEANRQKKEKALNRFLGHSQVRCGLFITAQHKMCVVQ